MVAWVVNDLSIGGQYSSVHEFLADFHQLLAARAAIGGAGHTVSCGQHLRYREIGAATTVLDAAHAITTREHRYLALAWLMKGPFWSPSPAEQGVVYLHDEDVTEQGLGEVARRRWTGEDARSFSFQGIDRFEVASLDVLCLREGAAQEEHISVPNAWNIGALREIVQAAERRTGWDGMLLDACERFSGLLIARDHIYEELSQYPFDKGAADRLLGILKCLDDLATICDRHGHGSKELADWMQTYVNSKRAAFSAERPKDRKVFTFKDPSTGKKIYCPWHGKVHNPLQYRVHYEWPMPKKQKKLKVLFIGEKITKV